MSPKRYLKHFPLWRHQRLCIWRLEKAKHLLMNGKVSGHDVFVIGKSKEYAMRTYRTVKVHFPSSHKTVYILVGVDENPYMFEFSVLEEHPTRFFTQWHEIAISQSKEKLEIWRDLEGI